MPSILLTKFKSLLAQYAANKIGDLEAMAYQYAEQKVQEHILELLNQCPPPEVLEAMAKQVDNINNLMNKVDKQVLQLKKLPDALDKPIKIGSVLVELLSSMPLPSTIGTPPGPAGGVIVSVPVGVIQKQAGLLTYTANMVITLKDDQEAIKSILDSAAGIFTPIRVKLQRIEMLLARCASNPNLSDEVRKNLLDGVQGDGRDGNSDNTAGSSGTNTGTEYTSLNGKTYNLSVIVNKETGISIQQRQAIAKDFRGIVVLKGPLSFAGSEKVLIDELKFRIDNQLP